MQIRFKNHNRKIELNLVGGMKLNEMKWSLYHVVLLF